MVKRHAGNGEEREGERSGFGLASDVAAFVRIHRLMEPHAPLIVMVSGGQDSVALLHVLSTDHRIGPDRGRITVLHVNHGLRGEESDADEALVRSLCAALGVELQVRRGGLDPGPNLQARAREERRRFALELATGRRNASAATRDVFEWGEEGEPPRIATGHTLDDQVETMLYRLGRYGGLAALDGLRPRRDPWVRPLLGVRRTDTESYCRRHGLAYARDRGNVSEAYARTGIRGRVLPAWEEELPGAVEAAGRAAEAAAEARDALDGLLALLEEDVVTGEQRWYSVPALCALPAPVRRLLLHRAVLAVGAPPESLPKLSRGAVLEVERLLWAAAGEASVELGAGVRAVRRYDRLRISPPVEGRRAPLEVPGAVSLPVPGTVGWGRLLVSAEVAGFFRAPVAAREAFLDARVVLGKSDGASLTVRAVRPGDRMRPLGASGRRKVQDILVDEKVPRSLRPLVPIIACGEEILWVGGYEVAAEGRITRDTESVLRLTVEERTEP